MRVKIVNGKELLKYSDENKPAVLKELLTNSSLNFSTSKK